MSLYPELGLERQCYEISTQKFIFQNSTNMYYILKNFKYLKIKELQANLGEIVQRFW
jgi:hypothetical protein